MFALPLIQSEYFKYIDNLSKVNYGRQKVNNKQLYWDYDKFCRAHDNDICKLCNKKHKWGNKEDCRATVRFCLYCCRATWFLTECDSPDCVELRTKDILSSPKSKTASTCLVCSECGRCSNCRKNNLNICYVPSWRPSKITPMWKRVIRPMFRKYLSVF